MRQGQGLFLVFIVLSVLCLLASFSRGSAVMKKKGSRIVRSLCLLRFHDSHTAWHHSDLGCDVTWIYSSNCYLFQINWPFCTTAVVGPCMDKASTPHTPKSEGMFLTGKFTSGAALGSSPIPARKVWVFNGLESGHWRQAWNVPADSGKCRVGMCAQPLQQCTTVSRGADVWSRADV